MRIDVQTGSLCGAEHRTGTTGGTSTRRHTLDRVLMPVSELSRPRSQSGAPGSSGSDPGAVSSLDNLETNDHTAGDRLKVVSQDDQERPVAFRHSGWQHDRAQVRAAIAAGGGRDHRLERWDRCGANRWLVRSQSKPELFRVHADLCRDRFCKPCASARSRIIAGNLAERMADGYHRLITLTIRSEQEPLAQLINHLYASFRLLRRTDLWRSKIRGGAAFLEIKYNVPLDRWHPHLHIIAEGDYIAVGFLTQEWHRITSSSCIVDVRKIPSRETVVRYVCKYASKPLSRSYIDDADRLCEAVTALTGRRLCMTFAAWRGWKLLKQTNDGPWAFVGPMKDIVRLAITGSTYHLDLLVQVGMTVAVQYRDHAWPGPRAPAETYLFDMTHDTRL